mmetsp:Transcript_19535/g.47201  ORF Transcript_19535/g.47201 Transcript_19535/m.47201 type:complete len:217 (-) Transcript_19535:49-699(-)
MFMSHRFNQTTAHCSSPSISLQQRDHLAFAGAFTKLHQGFLPSIFHHSDTSLKEGHRCLLRTRCSISDLPSEAVVVSNPLELTLQLLNVRSATLLHRVSRWDQLSKSHRSLELFQLTILLCAQRFLQFVGFGVEIHSIGPVCTLESCLLLLALKYTQYEFILILDDHGIDNLEDTGDNCIHSWSCTITSHNILDGCPRRQASSLQQSGWQSRHISC